MDRALAFYALAPTGDNRGYIGAILVTDEIGKPEEFRVTYPVRPTSVQRQLYGQSLVPHIGIELCGLPLLSALTHRPDLMLVSDDRLLGVSGGSDCPVVHLKRVGQAIEVRADADAPGFELSSSVGRFTPISVSLPPEYEGEKSAAVEALLSECAEHIDLLEPFERISAALKELAQQNPDFA